MPNERINIRFPLSLDLRTNVRIAGIFARKLTNLWSPSRLRLEQRPGSLEYATSIEAGLVAGNKTDYTETWADDYEPQIDRGRKIAQSYDLTEYVQQTQISRVNYHTLIGAQTGTIQQAATEGAALYQIQPFDELTSSSLPVSASSGMTPLDFDFRREPYNIANLWRIYLDNYGEKFWIGFIRWQKPKPAAAVKDLVGGFINKVSRMLSPPTHTAANKNDWDSLSKLGMTFFYVNESAEHIKFDTVKRYDGAYTDFSDEAGNISADDVIPFTDPMDANDAVYIGDTKRFMELQWNTSTLGVPDGVKLRWPQFIYEYWNGSAWTGFDPRTHMLDGVSILAPIYAFTNAQGVARTKFQPPQDWAQTAVDGETKYWVRLRCSDPGDSFTTFPKLTFLRGDFFDSKPSMRIQQNSEMHSTAGVPQFLPYRYYDPNGVTVSGGDKVKLVVKNFYGIICNGRDQLQGVFRGVTADGYTAPVIKTIVPNDSKFQVGNLAPTKEPSRVPPFKNTKFAIGAVNALENYRGSVVYGGFMTYVTEGGGEAENYKHCILFSDPQGTDYSCFNVSIESMIEVGDGPSEEVTAVATIPTQTDGVGIKGQLVAFTQNRIRIFDGNQPLPSDPTPFNFVSSMIEDFGCVASLSVVKTPYGLVFLGTDGVVYLLGTSGQPQPISRSMGTELSKLNAVQQKYVAAYYKDGYYVLSYPGLTHSWGHSNKTMNNRSIACDLRELDEQGSPKWFGPWTKQYHSCYALATGSGDWRQTLAGSSADGRLFEVGREDIKTDPRTKFDHVNANAKSKNGATPILCELELSVFDGEDVHFSKTLAEVGYSAAIDGPTDLKLEVSAFGTDATTLFRSFTDTVNPISRLGTYKLGTDAIGGGEEFRTITHNMPGRTRGRGFTLKLTEQASSSAYDDVRLGFGDFFLEFRKKGRR